MYITLLTVTLGLFSLTTVLFFALIVYPVPDVINNFRNLSYIKVQLMPDT